MNLFDVSKITSITLYLLIIELFLKLIESNLHINLSILLFSVFLLSQKLYDSKLLISFSKLR